MLRNLGMDDLLARDTTSYEFFYSLPPELQRRLKQRDFCSYEDMCSYVAHVNRRLSTEDGEKNR